MDNWSIAKQIMNFAQGTSKLGIWHCWSDCFGCVGSIDDKKSAARYAFGQVTRIAPLTSKKK